MGHERRNPNEIAIVLPSGVRLGSMGAFLDAIEIGRAWIRRQYASIDVAAGHALFDVGRVTLVHAGPDSPRTPGGIRVPDSVPLPWRRFDVVVIADHALGSVGADEQAQLSRWLLWEYERGGLIAACGASVGLFAETGLLDGQNATGPWFLAEAFRQNHPNISFDFGVDHSAAGRLLCSAGGSADLTLAVEVVRRITSDNMGLWLGRRLSRGSVPPDQPGSDPLVVRARQWLSERLSQPVRMDDLAEVMGVDRRTLHRHFKRDMGITPVGFLQSIRVGAAKGMLERSPFTIDRIASLVGYADVGYFRLTFHRLTGMTPRQWRAGAQPVIRPATPTPHTPDAPV